MAGKPDNSKGKARKAFKVYASVQSQYFKFISKVFDEGSDLLETLKVPKPASKTVSSLAEVAHKAWNEVGASLDDGDNVKKTAIRVSQAAADAFKAQTDGVKAYLKSAGLDIATRLIEGKNKKPDHKPE